MYTQQENQRIQSSRLYVLRQEFAEGLLYTHSRLNANTSKTLESASFLYALVELLDEKGLISIEELDERKRAVGQRLTAISPGRQRRHVAGPRVRQVWL